jgi:hypothetical protein
VKFADAQPSKLAEISVGDQVRARGEKSADGLTMTAQDVVFGTFIIEAGAIAAIDPEAKELKVKELGTNKLLTVKLTADSQLKQMFAHAAGLMPAGGHAGVGLRARSGGGPGGFDINQMIEHIPAVKLEDLETRRDRGDHQHQGREERRDHRHPGALQRRHADPDGLGDEGSRPAAQARMG